MNLIKLFLALTAILCVSVLYAGENTYIKQQVAYKDPGANGKELTWDFGMLSPINEESDMVFSCATLVGSKETIMQSFFNNYNFKKVRGTAAGVSYNRITREPEPQFFFQHWTIFER